MTSGRAAAVGDGATVAATAVAAASQEKALTSP